MLESSFLGLIDFKKSAELQNELHLQSFNTKNNYIIGQEHPAVLTLGYRADRSQEILIASEIPVERAARGGLATIHSEGQLVIYPILNLRELNLGVRDYVCLLLKTTQELLHQFGIDSYTDEKAVGLYTSYGKVAFCGVQIKNGISQHGLSLNVRNDLSLFSAIRSCGVQAAAFDRLCDHGINMTLSEIYIEWVRIFRTRL